MVELWNTASYEAIVNNPNVDFSKMAEEVMGNINSI